ncbi:hypothetical protein IAR55_000005 [Kwoniella newhampshirensis]|uniref:Zn(2)-C6 fungal-type domain-containing protein n=1 Tax=Kwoniella newhampshirensis TaxID=1651941 RepID=A0AAW0Z5N6_9TREE
MRDVGASSDKGARKRQRPGEQKKERTIRRALSCTECKRRKTKCSAVGRVPCDSCVQRGRPGDCFWEGLPTDADVVSQLPSDSEDRPVITHSDVAVLREQVEKLQGLVTTLTQQYAVLLRETRSPQGEGGPANLTPVPLSISSPVASPPAHGPSSLRDEIGSNVRFETTAKSIEHLVLGPSVRPGVTETSTYSVQTAGNPISTLLSSQLDGSPSRDYVIVDAILRLLPPSSTTSRILIEDYFGGPLHRGWHSVTKYTFVRQFEVYSAMNLEQQLATMDSAWVSVYLMASLIALDVANYLAVPQIRHIQVALLYINYLFHFGDSADKANLALRHLDSAISTAQWIGLDLVNDDPASAPIGDPAFADIPVHAAFETSKQLLHMLSFVDGTIYKRPGLWRLGNAVNVPTPGNLNDVDVLYDLSPTRRSAADFTDATLAILGGKFASTIRKYTKQGSSLENLPYDQVMEYDRALRAILHAIPPLAARNTQSGWMMHHLFSSIHNRLLRVHRPFMVKGYEDSRWAFSARMSVESAKAIISAQQLMMPFVKRWILGSAIVLAVDGILHGGLQQTSSSQSSQACLIQALAILQSAVNHGTNLDVSYACVRAIQALLDAMSGLSPGVVTATRDLDERLQLYFDEVERRIASPDSCDAGMQPPAPEDPGGGSGLAEHQDWTQFGWKGI